MRFRPCIDIHAGKVKQMVGGTIGSNQHEVTNYVSTLDSSYYAKLYREDGLTGGHVIVLSGKDASTYEASWQQAVLALQTFPLGLQMGGGVNASNAKEYIDYGASHVIVTSFLFEGAHFSYEKLESIKKTVGKERLVIDLSCRKKEGSFYVVTNRWQTFTEEKVTLEFLSKLSSCCDEFLIHGVDVEGKAAGMEEDLVYLLSQFQECPITYAGGIGSLSDLKRFQSVSGNHLDVTIGSALDLFGGTIPYDYVKKLK